MVFARTRLLIWDQIYEPKKVSIIRYKGPHPEKLYKKMVEIFKRIFNIPAGYVQEKEYNWEEEGEKERFKVEWQVDKPLDQFSYLDWIIEFKGFSAGGHGEAVIEFEPRLVTEYPQDNIWQQSIIYEMFRRFWHIMFYDKHRRDFLALGKDLTEQFENEIKDYMEKLRGKSAE